MNFSFTCVSLCGLDVQFEEEIQKAPVKYGRLSDIQGYTVGR